VLLGLALAVGLAAASAAQDDDAAPESLATSEDAPAEEAPSEKSPTREKSTVVLEHLDPMELEVLKQERQYVAFTEKLRARVSRYLRRAQKEVDRGNPEEAERLLLKIQEARLNKLESAYVYRYLGFLAFNDERPDDAIKYFKQALDLESMQLREDVSMRLSVAQLYMGIGSWQKAIDWFSDGLRYTPEPEAAHLYFMALAYFQLKDFDASIEHTKKAIELQPPPKEPWLRLLSALYAQEENFGKAIPVLEELVLRYPSRPYWVQLSLMYAANDEFPTSLAVQQAAYAQGFLVESKELQRLARSYLYHDLPYEAAKLLSKELDAGRIEPDAEVYELLANSYIASREYDSSLPPLQKAAALAEDGRLFVRLGQVHMQREEWEEAVANLRKAFDKGIPEKKGNAQVLLGIALLNLEKTGEAENSFQRALDDEASRAEAERWLDHIAKERQRAEQG
jgi:tetratricopeptide (TPR) repeat protein